MQTNDVDVNFDLSRRHYLKALQQQPRTLEAVGELARSTNCQSWLILAHILDSLAEPKPALHARCLKLLETSLLGIQCFATLMFVYDLFVIRKASQYFYGNFRSQYARIYNAGESLQMLSLWVTTYPESQVVQATLRMVMPALREFRTKEFISIKEDEVAWMVEWICFARGGPEIYDSCLGLAAYIREDRYLSEGKKVDRDLLIIKRLMELCKNPKCVQFFSNAFVLLFSTPILEQDIACFLSFESQFVLGLSDEHLCWFFTCLSKSALTYTCLHLLTKITALLRGEQQFHKLRALYLNYVLPVLASRYKAAREMEPDILAICQTYVLGFKAACQLGPEGLRCLCRGLGRIKSPQLRRHWVSLCLIAADEASSQKVQEMLQQESRQGQEQFEIDMRKALLDYQKLLGDPETTWSISEQSLQKYKSYQMLECRQRGIRNEGNLCYIIVIVQALYRNQLFRNFIKKYRNQFLYCPFLNELCWVFDDLGRDAISERGSKNGVRIQKLKQKGPEMYRASEQQEDVYEYLIHLFDYFEKQLKRSPNRLSELKFIFENTYISELFCQRCPKSSKQNEKSLVLTMPCTETLSESTTEPVPDFTCDQCRQPSCCIRRQLQATSQILIVHINRFTTHEGEVRKLLQTAKIERKFLNYTLVGMIFHKGRNVLSGHYIYVHRAGARKWQMFNDSEVREFELDDENEEFQKQWKAEMTPYMLFYQLLPKEEPPKPSRY